MLLNLLNHPIWISKNCDEKELTSSIWEPVDNKATIISISSERKTQVVLKNNSVLKVGHIGQMLDPKIDLKKTM